MESTFQKPLILVVDDDAFMRRFYKASLERHGATVALAANGAEALQRLAEGVVDLVVMDQMMPDKDGLQVTREMRQNPSTAGIPILMVTSNRSAEHQENARKHGVDSLMTKPLNLDRLLSRTHDLLHRNRRAVDVKRAPPCLVRQAAEVVSLEDVATQVLRLMRLSGKLCGVEVTLEVRQDCLVEAVGGRVTLHSLPGEETLVAAVMPALVSHVRPGRESRAPENQLANAYQ